MIDAWEQGTAAILPSPETVRCVSVFNGITLYADGASTVESIVADYHAQSEAKAKAWRASPEGKRATKEAADRQEALQLKADGLMHQLPSLDFSNVVVLLDWLSAIEDPRDHIGVKVDEQLIIDTFRAHGYEPNANCGDEFKEGDPDNYARWIIGQALNIPAYPAVSMFTEKWKEKFALVSP
jgi:hypothetical protein